MATGLRERKLWIQSCWILFKKNWPCVTSCSQGVVGKSIYTSACLRIIIYETWAVRKLNRKLAYIIFQTLLLLISCTYKIAFEIFHYVKLNIPIVNNLRRIVNTTEILQIIEPFFLYFNDVNIFWLIHSSALIEYMRVIQ